MSVYLDSSLLCKLYLYEPETPRVARWVQSQGQSVGFNSLHELEFLNSIQLHVFRKTLSQEHAATLQKNIEDDLAAGVLVRAPLEWNLVFAEAVRLNGLFSRKLGSRSLDILHVAGAVVSGCDRFATHDEKQAALAKAAGLKLLQV